MNRLTYEGDYCRDIAMCDPGNRLCGGSCRGKRLWERLKQYEDTGLEPAALAASWGQSLQCRKKFGLQEENAHDG